MSNTVHVCVIVFFFFFLPPMHVIPIISHGLLNHYIEEGRGDALISQTKRTDRSEQSTNVPREEWGIESRARAPTLRLSRLQNSSPSVTHSFIPICLSNACQAPPLQQEPAIPRVGDTKRSQTCSGLSRSRQCRRGHSPYTPTVPWTSELSGWRLGVDDGGARKRTIPWRLPLSVFR